MATSGRATSGTSGEAPASVVTPRRARGALPPGTAPRTASVPLVVLPGAARPSPGARPRSGRVVAGAAINRRNPAVARLDRAGRHAADDRRGFDVGRSRAGVFAQSDPSAVVPRRHRPVDDRVAAVGVADTSRRVGAGAGGGTAEASRAARRGSPDDAGRDSPAAVARPCVRAPFAPGGDGRGRVVAIVATAGP